MPKLINLAQIKGGMLLRSDLDGILQSYDAAKVITTIVKEGGDQYNVNELLISLKEIVDSQLGGDGEGSINDRLDALKAELEKAIADLDAYVKALTTDQIAETTDNTFVHTGEREAWDAKVGEVTLTEDMLSVDGTETKVITKYTSDVPSTVSVGGLNKGFTAPDGKNIEELLFELLHQYVAPGISLSGTPNNGGTFELGHTIPTLTFTANGRREADKLIDLKIFKDNVEVATKDVTVTGNDTLAHTETDLNKNATFKATVNDGKQTVSSGNVGFTFVHPIYVGKLPSETTAPTSDQVKALTKKVVGVSKQSCEYTVANERMAIAVPSNWTLKSAIDPNRFDMTNSFALVNSEVVCLDGTTQTYKVYMTSATNQNKFTVEFNF